MKWLPKLKKAEAEISTEKNFLEAKVFKLTMTHNSSKQSGTLKISNPYLTVVNSERYLYVEQRNTFFCYSVLNQTLACWDRAAATNCLCPTNTSMSSRTATQSSPPTEQPRQHALTASRCDSHLRRQKLKMDMGANQLH